MVHIDEMNSDVQRSAHFLIVSCGEVWRGEAGVVTVHFARAR